MLDHIYSSQVNKISPVSSKTESLHTLPVFVLLKGLLRSAGTENYIAGGGGGREGLVLRERANGKLFGKELQAEAGGGGPRPRWPGMCAVSPSELKCLGSLHIILF